MREMAFFTGITSSYFSVTLSFSYNDDVIRQNTKQEFNYVELALFGKLVDDFCVFGDFRNATAHTYWVLLLFYLFIFASLMSLFLIELCTLL